MREPIAGKHIARRGGQVLVCGIHCATGSVKPFVAAFKYGIADMILLLGATGHIGQAFGRELRRRRECFVPLSRSAFDYTRFELLFDYVRRIQPDFLINAAGYVGRPNVDACETARLKTVQANTLLPQTIARVCTLTNTPWGHVSSACIYSGARILGDREMRIARNLNHPDVRKRLETHPEEFLGFSELDEPNFSFRHPPCSYLAGTKALAEEVLRGSAWTYIWRVGLPFDERDVACNLLSKLQDYPKVYDHVPPVSHREDFARACLELWDRHASFGIYNVTNPGHVSTRQMVEMIQRILGTDRRFDFWADDDEFYAEAAKAPRCSCILDASKLRRVGVEMRPAMAALEASLEDWQPALRVLPGVETGREALAVA
jgi:dTDP-4-dehydrorhamnose reductase